MSLTEVYDIKSNMLHQNQILHAPVIILIISDCDLSGPLRHTCLPVILFRFLLLEGHCFLALSDSFCTMLSM